MNRGPHSTPATHPGAGALLDWVEDRLVGAARRNVSAHVRSCATCRSEAGLLRQVTNALRAEGADRPPADLRDWAAAIPNAGKRAFPLKPVLLRIITDSWGAFRDAASSLVAPLPSPLPAMRSTEGAAPRLGRRRILFSAGSCDLDLEIDYVGDSDPRRIRGQILPAGGTRRLWQGSVIRLVSSERRRVTARADRRGEFLLDRVRPGIYRIEIQGPVCCASSALEV